MKIILSFLAFATIVNASAEELKIVTLNVLATPWKAKQRIPALFSELEKSDADIIALQEVAPWFAKLLKNEQWLARYHYPKNERGDIAIAHEFLTLTKKKPTSRQVLKLPIEQGRIAFLTTIPFHDSQLTIISIHLDSFLEVGPIRAQQLDTIFENLKSNKQSILLGDFNFGDGEQPETARIPSDYIDPWLTLRASQPGYTWDRKLNKRANQDSFEGESSRRLDRILIKAIRLIQYL